ncbi:hypothetical protein M3890_004671 [Vibrio parahaemolyticus]|nr:hypothetical protein [Vibrio parahaemolyticus]HBC3550364.1 hypothetical protein [Vibrio parahaemolyticus]
MMKTTMKNDLIKILDEMPSFDRLYNTCKEFIENGNSTAKELADSIYELSKNIVDQDYYFDVLCEVMSALTDRCNPEFSLAS